MMPFSNSALHYKYVSTYVIQNGCELCILETVVRTCWSPIKTPLLRVLRLSLRNGSWCSITTIQGTVVFTFNNPHLVLGLSNSSIFRSRSDFGLSNPNPVNVDALPKSVVRLSSGPSVVLERYRRHFESLVRFRSAAVNKNFKIERNN